MLKKSLIALLLLVSASAFASILPPESVEQDIADHLTNPHPPQTDADKARVAFAENVVRALLKTNPVNPHSEGISPRIFSSSERFKLKVECIKSKKCLNRDAALQKYLDGIFQQYGSVTEFKYGHIIPWSFEKFKSKPVQKEYSRVRSVAPAEMPVPELTNDEYMIHFYAKFSNNLWYHLDVVVSEDAHGNMEFHYFYLFEFPLDNQELPKGVVC